MEYELVEAGDGTFDDKGGAAQDPLVRVLSVPDSLTVSDLNVGMVLDHTWRGDVRVKLRSPLGTEVDIIALPSSDSNDHFDVVLDSASVNPLDNGSNENTASPYYERVAAPSNSLDAFNGENAQGDWTFEFTDLQVGATSERTGLFRRAKLIFNSAGSIPLTVRLFDDRDWDGVYHPGLDTNVVAGATVRLYDAAGASVIGTDCGDGTYALDPGTALTGDVFRLEVDGTTLPSGYEAGIISGGLGANAGPFVQMVDLSGGPVTLNIPVQVPKVACTQPSDLDLFTTCFVGGPRDSMTPVATLDENGDTIMIIPAISPAVVVAARSSAGPNSPTPERFLATIQEVGATCGMGLHESQARAYVGAFVKRHTELGPDGSGAIYVLGLGGGGVVDSFVVPNAGSTVQGVDATGTHATGTHGAWLRDSDIFGAVGKEGLGDVELNDAEDTLWTINLNNRRLYMIDVATPYTASYGTVIDLGSIADPGCPDPSDWRPFALEWHDGDLYLGGTCTGQSTGDPADLAFRIFRVNSPTTPAATVSMTEVFRTAPGALQYNRGDASVAWQAWIDAWDVNAFSVPSYASFAHVYPQPWLTDFEFDNNNSLILGVRDRFGDQIGINTQSPGTDGPGDPASETGLFETVSMGELLHAEFSAASGAGDVGTAVLGDWTLELEAAFSGPLRDDPNDAFNPGPDEFYFHTSFSAIHPETGQGGLAFHPDWPDQIVTTSQDPFALRSGGFAFYYTEDEPVTNPDFSGPTAVDDSGTSPYQNGAGSGGIQVYGGQNTGGQVEQSLFGKAGGLGDLEYGCGLTTMQIGNRVWLDEDADGVQDPGEVPIPDVTVSLYVDLNGDAIYEDFDANPGPDAIATTTTDSDGYYYFTARPNTDYAIVFDLSSAGSFNDSQGQPVDPNSLTPTKNDVTSGVANDGNDSDASSSVAGLPAIALRSGDIGVSNHSSDAGFVSSALAGVGNLVFIDVNQDGLYSAGSDTAVAGLEVELWAPGPDGMLDGVDDTLLAETTTGSGPAAGCYSFRVEPGDYIVHIPEESFQAGGVLERHLSIAGQDLDDGSRTDDHAAGQDNGSDSATPESGGVSSVLLNLALGSEASGALEGGKDGSGDDAGDTDIDYTVDFGFRMRKARSYGEYLADAGLTAGTSDGQPVPDGSGGGGNPDGDWASNLLEHAFCDTPTSGVPNHAGFCVELIDAATGQMDASFIRAEGVEDVIYTLQGSDSMLGPWFVIDSIAAGAAAGGGFSAVSNGDETETVTYANVQNDPGYAASDFGFARLCVSLDADQNGTPDTVLLPSDGSSAEATDCTKIFGWQCVPYNIAQCASFSHPFTQKPVFSGLVDANDETGATVDASGSAGGVDLASLNLGPVDLDPGPAVQLVPTHYLQLTSGSLAGERFDIASASGGTLTLVNDPDIFTGNDPAFNPTSPSVDSLNTSDGVPADNVLVGAAFQVLPHNTFDSLFDKNGAFAGLDSVSDETRLLFYENRHETPGFTTASLANTAQGIRWVYASDPNAIDQGLRPVDRCTGLYIHSTKGATTVCASGVVADYALACPFDEGRNLTGSPYPLDQTMEGSNGRAMTVGSGAAEFGGGTIPTLASEVFLWLGDLPVDELPAVAPYLEGYKSFMAADAGALQQWVDATDPSLADLGVDANGPLLLRSGRALTLKLLSGEIFKPHIYPLPTP